MSTSISSPKLDLWSHSTAVELSVIDRIQDNGGRFFSYRSIRGTIWQPTHSIKFIVALNWNFGWNFEPPCSTLATVPS